MPAPHPPAARWAATAVLVLAAALALGCQKKPVIPRPEGVIAVAGFTNPTQDWELLAGHLAEEGRPVPEGVLQTLDTLLAETLRRHQVQDYIRPEAVRECQDTVVFVRSGLPQFSAWKYWLSVGQCLKADYLLVPQVLHWRERVGSAGGVTTPAAVTLDFFLIEVRGEIVYRARFEEAQESLLENLLEADKFARRGGKWLTASQLAADGMEEKLAELGL